MRLGTLTAPRTPATTARRRSGHPGIEQAVPHPPPGDQSRAILGIWIGGFIYPPLWATIFLAIGIGAIAQVIVEVGRLIIGGRERREAAFDWTTLAGVATGIAIMYVTALVVAA